jgi:hypothetical protein
VHISEISSIRPPIEASSKKWAKKLQKREKITCLQKHAIFDILTSQVDAAGNSIGRFIFLALKKVNI